MAHKINTNNKDYWELYSTVAEGPIAVFKTKNELIRHIALRKVYEGKLNAIREMMSFPSEWYVNDDYQWRDIKAYQQWYKGVLMAPDVQYYNLIDEKYEELMEAIK